MKEEVQVEAGDTDKVLSLGVLVACDLFSYLVFAIGGRMTHSSGGPADWLANTPRIIAPFLIGWFTAALVFEAYPRSGGIGLRSFALNSILAVLVGNAIGFALRVAVFGDGIDPAFIIAALSLTTLVVVGLRLLYYWYVATRTSVKGKARG
ncbi:MAG: DUF3054 domain-containing protein [Caldilineaceae bacterium]|nr:DUF3054 domain-containing protein [Caldilineaceae bacterium]MDE0339707.1 DUF3054 domain-containing protein [Caldilineaceae bacterium]